MLTKYFTIAAIVFSYASAFMAQARAADHDAQSWLSAVVKVDLADRWTGIFEAKTKFGSDLSRLKSNEFKGVFLYDLTKNISAGAGYGYYIANKPGSDVIENRVWQEANWKLGAKAGLHMALRTRLEERFVESGDDTGLRLRQRIKVTRPISDGASTYVYGSGEAFFALNDTDWGAHSGFDRTRIAAGLGVKLTKTLKMEAGYLNEFRPKPSSEDEFNHAVTLKLSASL